LSQYSENKKQESAKARPVYNACPNCGHELSPWQQVLLSVDRALVCKNCWYRIILDVSESQEITFPPKDRE